MRTATGAEGRITADSMYTLDEIRERMKLGTHALRVARRDGLPVRYIGRRGYVLGADLIEYVRGNAKTDK